MTTTKRAKIREHSARLENDTPRPPACRGPALGKCRTLGVWAMEDAHTIITIAYLGTLNHLANAHSFLLLGMSMNSVASIVKESL